MKKPLVGPEQVDIFVSGENGYNTYRIPAIIVSSEGTLLAFCEGRKDSRSDSGAINMRPLHSLNLA